MSTNSCLGKCPRCGGDHYEISTDSKPLDLMTGICLDCGLLVETRVSLRDLGEVNLDRQDRDLPEIELLCPPLLDWALGNWDVILSYSR